MKVTKRNTFEPITIVLETKEEADLMFHLLNCPSARSMQDYVNYDINIKLAMFASYVIVYDPVFFL